MTGASASDLLTFAQPDWERKHGVTMYTGLETSHKVQCNHEQERFLYIIHNMNQF